MMVDKSKNNKILSANSIKSLINKNQKDNLSKKDKYYYIIKKQKFKSNNKKNSDDKLDNQDNNQELPSEIENILVEIISTIWTIGNTAINYQNNNQLSFLNDLLENYEKILSNNINKAENNSNNDSDSFELNKEEINFKNGQKIIKDSLRPIDSISRYYETLMVKLSKSGFEVKDRTGQKYTPGMSLDVLVFETNPQCKVNRITETIKPEIYYKDKLISRAQVIVTLADSKE